MTKLDQLRGLRTYIDEVLEGHDDHCGGRCRIDLDGHDCCYTCNMIEMVLDAAIPLSKRFGRPLQRHGNADD
jgi:hypothetical protein